MGDPVLSELGECVFLERDRIVLAHGDGGLLTHRLVEGLFLRYFDNEVLGQLADAAVLEMGGRRMAVTTDSFVVKPPVFPGGDIGKLAVAGTVNDLAVSGARPLYLTAGFILEEGLEISLLENVVRSMAATAKQAGVTIVAGDTKVVERGHGDGIYVNTTGIGVAVPEASLGYSRVAEGDLVVVSGSIGEHGMAVLLAREDFGFWTTVESDCAPLADLVLPLLERFPEIKFLRDPTRGGVATVVKEVALAAKVDVTLWSERIPVSPAVSGAAEVLGMDPLYLACEGRFVAFVGPDSVDELLGELRSHPLGSGARVIGEVHKGNGRVYLRNPFGGRKLLELPSGAQVPRIC